MSADAPRSLTSSAWRFVVAGGFNTLVTGVALSLLAQVIDPRLAYTIVFLVGIGISVALAGGFVFGVAMTRRLVVLYVAMYLLVYVVGLGVVALADAAGMPDIGSGLVVLVTAPLTFIGGRLLLTRGVAAPTDPLERTQG
ncbi:GtrA family protein [Actinotalea subterranea]|uniref:GtrA family protein n=1 Tax=Actinotalea subterranea TaxID=2607497 RepID=UPI0011EF764A|nr:GtrA family protein [Actinotalea subterranea]